MARSSVKNARKPRARSLSPSGRESGNSSDHERHFFTKHSSPTQKNNKFKRCPWPNCGWSNLQKSNLDYHISRTHHKLRKPVTCPDCFATLSSKSSYDRHARHKQWDRQGKLVRCPGQPIVEGWKSPQPPSTPHSEQGPKTGEKQPVATTPPPLSRPRGSSLPYNTGDLNGASSNPPNTYPNDHSPAASPATSVPSPALRLSMHESTHGTPASTSFAHHRDPRIRSTPPSLLRGPGIPGRSDAKLTEPTLQASSPPFRRAPTEWSYDSDNSTLALMPGLRRMSIDSWSNALSARSTTLTPNMRADGREDLKSSASAGYSKFYDPVRDVERYPKY